jgi:hypothetical protein
MITINKRVQRRVASASAAPNLSELATELRNAERTTTTSEQAKQGAGTKMRVAGGKFNTLAVTAQNQITQAETAPSLSAEITKCVAKAGS